MEAILEHCESTDKQNVFASDEQEEYTEIIESASKDPKEQTQDSDSTEKHVSGDDASSETDMKMNFLDYDSMSNTMESVTEFGSETKSKHDAKDLDISFDEDIILPSVRHDPELEQKQRDRIKRKEMKSRKELEEEEREKMQ